jgi:hypothetical protein
MHECWLKASSGVECPVELELELRLELEADGMGARAEGRRECAMMNAHYVQHIINRLPANCERVEGCERKERTAALETRRGCR